MPRALWKGAITFGLVNIPVDLYSGARSSTIDLDWIDKRDMSPVGYQRINKSTGKTVSNDQIVKGYQYSKGHYVILSEEDFKQANPKATQTVVVSHAPALVEALDADADCRRIELEKELGETVVRDSMSPGWQWPVR